MIQVLYHKEQLCALYALIYSEGNKYFSRQTHLLQSRVKMEESQLMQAIEYFKF